MTWLFVGAFLLGAGLIAMGSVGDTDHDLGGGAHADVDGDTVHGAGLLAVFSLRNIAWASLAFGGIGLLAVLTRRTTTTSLVTASVSGIVTLLGVHLLFHYLRRSEAGDLPSDAQVFGTPARLVLPFNDAGVGLISFRANGQLHELPARRSPEVAAIDGDQFTECRIEYIENGVAMVQPGGL